MKLGRSRRSENVEDRRGAGPVGRRGTIGIGTVVLVLAALYFGVDPNIVLQQVGAGDPGPVTGPAPAPSEQDAEAQFMARVLGDTEQTWHELFAAAGARYREPKLVLFSGSFPTACGMGQAAMGPFYCPGDEKVYIDLTFYEALKSRFQAPGDFAQAYVIAHEVGHHVQHLLGTTARVQSQRQRLGAAEANALSVRMELQADCFAGLWAHHADAARQVLEQGEVEEALRAASAIGDDTLQRQTQGQVVPESFTHGSAGQRVRWFRRGLEQGDVAACDTFSTDTL
jgi:predicted metalloprotease